MLEKRKHSLKSKGSLRTSPRRGEVLALRDWELGTTVVRMLRSLMGNVDDVQEQVSVRSRDGNTKQESKENSRGEKPMRDGERPRGAHL